MRGKITDYEQIEALYKEGKISRTTLWRAKKRGWIALAYHSKKKENTELKEQDKLKLYWTIYKIAGKKFNIYSRDSYDHTTFKQVVGDIAGDVFLDILEYKTDLQTSLKKIGWKVREYLTRKGKYYEKYFLPADTAENRRKYDKRNMLSLESIIEAGIQI